MIGGYQLSFSEGEEENEEEVFEQIEIKGPYLEEEEAKEHTPTQEYIVIVRPLY